MTARIAVPLASAAVGVLPGLFVVWLHLQETRWIVFLAAALPIGAALLVSEHRSRWLWPAFVLCSQAYVSVRFLHAYAGSNGLEFPLMFLLGAAVAACELLERGGRGPTALRFGGPLALPISLIFATALLSLLFTSELFVGLTELLRLCQFYGMYLVGLNFAGSPERIQQTVRLLAVVLLTQSAIFAVQAYIGVTFSLTGETFDGRGVRAGGSVGSNSAIYATFVSPIILILAAHVLSPKTKWRERRLLAVPLATGLASTVFTLRRGAWGGIALGLAWLVFFGMRRRALSSWVPWAGAAALALVLLASPWIGSTVDSFRSDNPLAEALDERLHLMRIAIEVIEEHPVFGVGLGAYPHTFKQHVSPELFVGWVSTVHNYYLLLAAETGIGGALAFALFLVMAARSGIAVSRTGDPRVTLTALGCSAAVVSHAFAVAWEPLRDFAPNALLWFLIGMTGATTIANGRDQSSEGLAKERR